MAAVRADGALTVTIKNALSGSEIIKCTVHPSDLVVHLKASVKAVQNVPEIRLLNKKGEFLNPVQSVQDVCLEDNDTIFAVLMAQMLVAVASADGRVKTFNTDRGTLEREVQVAPARSLLCACFSADGRQLASGSSVATPKLWDSKSGDLKKLFEEHLSSVSCVDISWNSRLVVSGSYDFTARVWDVETGQCTRILVDEGLETCAGMEPRSHELQLLAVRFSPFDSNIVVTTSSDCTAKVWNVETGKCTFRLVHDKNSLYGQHPVTSVCFTMNGKEIVTTFGMYATLWDVLTGEEIRTWEAHTSPVTCSAHSLEDALLLTGCRDGTAKLWDLHSGLCRNNLEGHDGPVCTVALAPDSKLAVTGSADGQAKIWNARTGACERTLQGNKFGVVMASFVPC